jgi:hypothetical protein
VVRLFPTKKQRVEEGSGSSLEERLLAKRRAVAHGVRGIRVLAVAVEGSRRDPDHRDGDNRSARQAQIYPCRVFLRIFRKSQKTERADHQGLGDRSRSQIQQVQRPVCGGADT